MRNKVTILIVTAVAASLILGGIGFWWWSTSGTSEPNVVTPSPAPSTSAETEPAPTPSVTPEQEPEPSPNESLLASDLRLDCDPEGLTYIQGILIVNKTYPLPSDCNPGIHPEVQEFYDQMVADARASGIDIFVVSGFRSYDYQANLYNRYVQNQGKENADRFSARPGHSEHQSGLVFDVNSVQDSDFEPGGIYYEVGQWIETNSHKYGFIIRFLEGKEEVTGYQHEPWHIRYIGVENATKVYESGLALEEYFNITSEYQD